MVKNHIICRGYFPRSQTYNSRNVFINLNISYINIYNINTILHLQKDGYIDEDTNMETEPCYGKRCTANEHCCVGSVCVDVDGGNIIYLL